MSEIMSEKYKVGRMKVTQEEISLLFWMGKYCVGDLQKSGPFEQV